MPIPNLTGWWGGYVSIKPYGLTGLHAGIHAGLQTDLTMMIEQSGTNAEVSIRSGYFGRNCGDYTSPLGPFHVNPARYVCPNHHEIPLSHSSSGASLGFYTNVSEITKTYPLNYGTHNTNVGFDMPYHMDFWTHSIAEDSGTVNVYEQRHWCVGMDSVSPVGGNVNVPILEVRFIVVNKPGYNDKYWFCSGTLAPYHDWEPFIDPSG